MNQKYLKLVLGIILICVIVGVSFLLLRETKKTEKKEVEFEEKQLTNLQAGAGIYGFSWSPNGKKIVFVTYTDYYGERSFDVWVMDSDGNNQKRLTGPGPEGDEFDPSWSPDGKKIVFVSNKEGGLFESYFGERKKKFNLWIMDSNGENQKRLSKPEESIIHPSWSPDGKKIVFLSSLGDTIDLCIADSDGENEKRLVKDSREKWNPSWSPNGGKIIFEATPFTPEPLALPLHSSPQELWIINSDGSEYKPLKKVEGIESVVKSSWSPDGEKIVFELYKNDRYNIWIMDNDGSNQIRLTGPEENTRDPSWSPDGKKIAFSLFQENNSNIWIMDNDGSNPKQLTTDKMDDFNPVWSPDGKKITFTRGGEIWKITLE